MTAPARAGADLRLLRAAVFAAVCVTLSAAGHELASGAGIPLWALAAAWVAVLAVAAPLAGRERSLPGITVTMLVGEMALHVLFSVGQCWRTTASNGSSASAAGRGSPADQVAALAGRLVCHTGPLPLTAAGAGRLVRRAGIDPASIGSIGTGGAVHAVAAASTGSGTADAVSHMRWMAGMAGMTTMPGMAGGHGGMPLTWSMVAGHAVAALVVGWLLWRGEAAVWRVVRLSGCAASRIALRFPLLAAVAAVRALALTGTVRREADGRPARYARRAGDEAVPASATLRHAVIRRGPPLWALAA